MNILYITNLHPRIILDHVLLDGNSSYVLAPQKFHKNLVNGFIANDHNVRVLSYLPPNVEYFPDYCEDRIIYSFSKYQNKVGVKHLQIAIDIFRKILVISNTETRPDAIICDVLNVSLCIGALLARKLLGITTVGIVTDLLGICKQENKGFVQSVSAKIFNNYISTFDKYVLLTETMNSVVNPHQRPYIVMEGLCDTRKLKPMPSKGIRKLFYAGGLPSKDGLDILIPAFKRIKDDNIQLNIYGSIPNVKIGPHPDDKRIIFHGVVGNDEIVKEECSSYLLINPRPTNEEYTKYSFPSKVIEYMSTGVPMVSTKLAGIPEEYYNYMFTFEKCDIDTYYKTLIQILALSESQLFAKGLAAQSFLLKNKNNLVQTERIIKLLTYKQL